MGATPKFRREVVPSIWHWAAGHVSDPWNIDEDEMVGALVAIWEVVYAGTVSFDIPPTVSVVSESLFFSFSILANVSQTNQRFSEWRNGFASAAVSALISLFASDVVYLQYKDRVGLALDMTQHYRFLFEDTDASDYTVSFSFFRS